MAVLLVLGEFVGEDELVEDTGSHEDGFTRAHGQGEDVVRVESRLFLHALEDGLVVILVQLLQQ